MSQFPPFDKMDPKTLMEMSQLIQQLPPEQLSRMQTLMHNMMAGFDVRREMEEFEKTLPAGFREKLMSLMAGQMGAAEEYAPSRDRSGDTVIEGLSGSAEGSSAEMNIREARLTILRAVAEGRMTPEQAEKLLFK